MTAVIPVQGAPSSFRLAFRRHPAGVVVVTVDAERGPAGFTATSLTSVSADPPLVSFSLSSSSSSWPHIRDTRTVVVNFLGARQEDIARRFATSGIDRFAAPTDWTPANPSSTTCPAGCAPRCNFGRTGVKVSPLTLGAMMFGQRGNPDHDDSVRIIHRALDAGINTVDTADVYSAGESETIVGKALLGRRDNVVLATKFHGPLGEDPNERGNSRRWIVREVEHSLRRLQTDWIDLYQVHRPEPGTDFDETLGALSDLVRQGKIRYIGTSTFEPSAIVEGQWIAEKRGRERVVSEQPPYSLLARGVEREVLPVAQRYGLAVIPWSPLAGGWLTGKYRKEGAQPQSSRADRFPERFDIASPENAAKLEATEALAQLAEQSGLSLIHLALAFVLEHPAITSAIIGPRTVEQLESQLGAVDVRLSADVLDQIDKIVPPGVTLSGRDLGYQPPSLSDPASRRRG